MSPSLFIFSSIVVFLKFYKYSVLKFNSNIACCINFSLQGGNSWGSGGGGLWPPKFWPATLFSGFSHTTDRKVPSEVVLMGSFMSVIFMVMSNKTAIFQLKVSRIMTLFFNFIYYGITATPSIGSPALPLLLAPPPTFKWKLPPC